jgi:hypothetical protein
MMIILQEAFFITSAPDDFQMVMGAFFVISALVVFGFSVEAGMGPSMRNWTGTFLTADYWIRRHKRRGFAWTLAADRSHSLANQAGSAPANAFSSKPLASGQVVSGRISPARQ